MNALLLRKRLGLTRVHSRRSRTRVERWQKQIGPASAYRLWPSAGDHAQEDAIPAHEMMMQRRADVRGHQARNGDAENGVDEKKSLGRKTGAVGRKSRRACGMGDIPGSQELGSVRRHPATRCGPPALSVNDSSRDHGTVQCNPTQARQIDIPVMLPDSEPKPEKGGSKIRTPR